MVYTNNIENFNLSSGVFSLDCCPSGGRSRTADLPAPLSKKKTNQSPILQRSPLKMIWVLLKTYYTRCGKARLIPLNKFENGRDTGHGAGAGFGFKFRKITKRIIQWVSC